MCLCVCRGFCGLHVQNVGARLEATLVRIELRDSECVCACLCVCRGVCGLHVQNVGALLGVTLVHVVDLCILESVNGKMFVHCVSLCVLAP